MLKYLKAIYDSLYPTVNNEYTDVLDRKIDEMKFEPIKYSYCKFSKKELTLINKSLIQFCKNNPSLKDQIKEIKLKIKELKLGLQNACDR